MIKQKQSERDMTVEREFLEVPLNLINTKSENFRLDMEKEDLSELMATIQEVGVMQPIGLKEDGSGRYDIVWGNRRFWACKKLKKHSIPASFVTPESRQKFLQMHMFENLTRKDLTPSEEGRAFLTVMNEGLSLSEIATLFRKTPGYIDSRIKIFKEVPEEFREMVRPGHAGRGKRAKGRIPVSLSMKIISARKSGRITTSQAKKLYEMATQDHHKVMANFSACVKAVVNQTAANTKESEPIDQTVTFQPLIRITTKTERRLISKYLKTGAAGSIPGLIKKILTGEIRATIDLV